MKIAFCFLSYGDIEHQSIWSSFFGDKHAVFLHRADGLTTSTLPGCIVIPSIQTAWGTFQLLQAQQNLFEEACKDPDVMKCVLLSGDTIPLYTIDKVLAKLSGDDKGYMRPIANSATVMTTEKKIELSAWPIGMLWKGSFVSQWVVLHRDHVQLLHDHWPMLVQVFQNAHIPDEYMYYIFFYGVGVIDSFHMSSPMYVNHSKRVIQCEIKHHATPMTYHRSSFTPLEVKNIYKSDCLFLRKVCPKTTIYMDWNKPWPLRNNGANTLMNMGRRR